MSEDRKARSPQHLIPSDVADSILETAKRFAESTEPLRRASEKLAADAAPLIKASEKATAQMAALTGQGSPISQASPPIKPLSGSGYSIPPSRSSVPSASPSPAPPPSIEPTVADRVADFYGQLSAAAVDLNKASDELGRSVVMLDAALKKLNLGISTWVTVWEDEDRQNLDFWTHALGYTKISGKWGVAIRTVEGNSNYPDQAESEEWLFGDAPRTLRLEAVDKIPDLLEQLIADARSASQRIRGKVSYADQIAVAIGKAANVAAPQK